MLADLSHTYLLFLKIKHSLEQLRGSNTVVSLKVEMELLRICKVDHLCQNCGTMLHIMKVCELTKMGTVLDTIMGYLKGNPSVPYNITVIEKCHIGIQIILKIALY